MFIKRNRRKASDDGCTSVLLVQGERVPVKRPPGRPRKDAPPRKTKVVHRVLANLTKVPPELVAVVEAHCRGELMVASKEDDVCVGPAYGALAAGYVLARECGLVRALGSSRKARLALFLVLARLIHHGSRLSAVRWAEDQAVSQVLGVDRFDEDSLYAALDWLADQQERVELELVAQRPPAALFLYDVTSSYLEGQQNELAAAGYNRDGKRFKKQVVVGLLTDIDGDPIAVRVFRGNTSDPQTVSEPIKLLAEKMGVSDVVFVGDRGMVKANAREALSEAGFRYITALTKPQIRSLLKQDILQLELFDSTVAEVHGESGRRFVFRCNPETQARCRQRRASQLARVQRKVDKRNALVVASSRAKPEVSLKYAQSELAKYKLDRFVSAVLEDRQVALVVDIEKKKHVELLDGCYVIDTDVSAAELSSSEVHARYMDLTKVERDFRTMKTGLLEIRPIFLRKAVRTRAHAFVTMLALKLARLLEARVAPLGLTVQDALARLDGVRLVTFSDPKLDGVWRLPIRFAKPQQAVLEVLPTLPAPRCHAAAT